MENGAPEKLLRKSDVDFAFSFNKSGWEKAALTIKYPGYETRIGKHETGVSLIAYDSSNGVGLSIQPLFSDDSSPPNMVVVGSHFPVGMLPPMTETLKQEMETTAQKELGELYSINLVHRVEGQLESVEFLITKV